MHEVTCRPHPRTLTHTHSPTHIGLRLPTEMLSRTMPTQLSHLRTTHTGVLSRYMKRATNYWMDTHRRTQTRPRDDTRTTSHSQPPSWFRHSRYDNASEGICLDTPSSSSSKSSTVDMLPVTSMSGIFCPACHGMGAMGFLGVPSAFFAPNQSPSGKRVPLWTLSFRHSPSNHITGVQPFQKAFPWPCRLPPSQPPVYITSPPQNRSSPWPCGLPSSVGPWYPRL
mmetsp:Transcript_53718/g.135066  ORF Transcript_53718/g.135066 Transcript_53718/m.135066 type:complete len:225 (+) Transcript_53718:36-710(+)